ncbi:MAG TPA: zf-HC2 domain-containing protein [Vicinamibacterales bacterium]
MIGRHPSRWIPAYCDDQLPPKKAQTIAAHLERCERCRRECDDVRFAAALLREMPIVPAPDDLWISIDRLRGTPETSLSSRRSLRWQLVAVGALLALLIGGLAYREAQRFRGVSWEVTIVANGASRTARQPEGAWIQTSSSTRAHVKVGSIGAVDVEPDTRLRLGHIDPSQYRLALGRGSISARVTAPPRLFVVDTPSSTLVDLGCAYHVQVDEQGTGQLTVTEGWTSLEWRERESLVPAGASCPIRRGAGPGIPAFDDASAALKAALATIDAGDESSLDVALSEARVRDTLSLWHVLTRTQPADRQRVFDRLQALVPMPDGVTRDQVLRLDPNALRKWREEMAWMW